MLRVKGQVCGVDGICVDPNGVEVAQLKAMGWLRPTLKLPFL